MTRDGASLRNFVADVICGVAKAYKVPAVFQSDLNAATWRKNINGADKESWKNVENYLGKSTKRKRAEDNGALSGLGQSVVNVVFGIETFEIEP